MVIALPPKGWGTKGKLTGTFRLVQVKAPTRCVGQDHLFFTDLLQSLGYTAFLLPEARPKTLRTSADTVLRPS